MTHVCDVRLAGKRRNLAADKANNPCRSRSLAKRQSRILPEQAGTALNAKCARLANALRRANGILPTRNMISRRDNTRRASVNDNIRAARHKGSAVSAIVICVLVAALCLVLEFFVDGNQQYIGLNVESIDREIVYAIYGALLAFSAAVGLALTGLAEKVSRSRH